MNEFIKLLQSWGYKESQSQPWSLGHKEYRVEKEAVILGAGREGYSGFYCVHSFDSNGNHTEHFCAE